MPPDEYTYRLRRTWPEKEHDWLVIDAEEVTIARIYLDSSFGDRKGNWRYFVGALALPQSGGYRGVADTLEAAQRRVKALWPMFRRQWTDEVYEQARREFQASTEMHRRWSLTRGTKPPHRR